MSNGITVKLKDSAGGMQLAGGQHFFYVEGSEVVLLGDAVQPHGKAPHMAPNMSEGSSWMKLNGIPVCRQGHKASCGHASTGRTWFSIA